MIISELSHFEEISEVPTTVVGGLYNVGSFQQNWANLVQYASAKSTSYSIGGSAIAVASASNIGQIAQSNS